VGVELVAVVRRQKTARTRNACASKRRASSRHHGVYQGIYLNGVIVLDGKVDLREGDTVEVTPTRDSSARSGKAEVARARLAKAASKPKTKRSKAFKYPLPGFGAWKDRADIGDSADFARGLRARVSARSTKSWA
jgi:predicted DNA-binding antitoxin AbrB/MazE fold protein